MQKIALVPALVALLFAGVVSAQTYYPNYQPSNQPGGGYSSGCVNLSSDLSYGSRGSDVTKLQGFLVSQNYPGGGSWMVTGYFGQATVTAVRNFQQMAGLPITGFVDSQTRAAIQSRTCGGIITSSTFGGGTYTTPTYIPPAPSYPPVQPPANTTGVQPNIGSLSSHTGVPGTSIVVRGSNFDRYTNAIHLGGTSVNAPSSTGTELTFFVPSISPGTYQLSISNARGTSNSVPFTVSVPGPTTCGFGYSGNCCNSLFGQTCPLAISILSPSSGGVNTSVTVHGTGFSPTGNTVRFGQGIIANARSFDGTSLSFTVPSTLVGYGTAPLVIGSYPVSVTNAYGETSNALPFNLTSTANAPTIKTVSGPTSLTAGTQGTWTLTVNAPGGSYVTTSIDWGDGGVGGYQPQSNIPQSTYIQGNQVLTFTHTYFVSGTFSVRFTVSNAAGSDTETVTVNVTPGSGGGPLSLSSLAPFSGPVGSTVTLIGSGFTQSGNVVHFGIGGKRDVAGGSGSIITYTIPSHISPCDLIQPGHFCGAPTTPVIPGVYPIHVTNTTGATNILYFTVTQ